MNSSGVVERVIEMDRKTFDKMVGVMPDKGPLYNSASMSGLTVTYLRIFEEEGDGVTALFLHKRINLSVVLCFIFL